MCSLNMIFFFQKKKAVEVRISDWSSDVCSSDLTVDFAYRSSLEYLTENNLTGLPDEYYQRFNSYTDQKEIAGFGEVTGRFSDSFWVTGGLRYGSTEVQSFTRGGGYNSNYLTAAFLGLENIPLTVAAIPYAAGLRPAKRRVGKAGVRKGQLRGYA